MTNKFDIQITDQQSSIRLDCDLIRRAVEQVLQQADKARANISIAVVDNVQIHKLNRTHLQHDYATDVLSFVFENSADNTDGEIVVSAEMAVTIADRFGAKHHDELLLYVVHGALHLVGHDDKEESTQTAMVAAEREALQALGIAPPLERDTPVGFIQSKQEGEQ